MQLAPTPPLPVIKTSGEEGRALGGAKILQKIMAPPLSVIKIVKYCDVVGGGRGTLVALKSYKHNSAPSLFVRLLSIVASGEGGGHWWHKTLQKIMTPIKINKYCRVGGGGGIEGALKFYKG